MKTAVGITGGVASIIATAVIQVAAAEGHPLPAGADVWIGQGLVYAGGLASLAYAWWQHNHTKKELANESDQTAKAAGVPTPPLAATIVQQEKPK